MANWISPEFKQIDILLAQYYQHLNVANYSNSNGDDGLFLNYIKTEELHHPQLPIEEELGDKCDPYDCTYTEIWMNSSANFPIPSYAQIPDNTAEAFIFYILQYCYKYGQTPTDEYIQNVLVPQCDGTINIISLLPQDEGLGSFEDFPAASPVYDFPALINCYFSRLFGGYIICKDIINCIQLYYFGKEGSMYCEETDDDSFTDNDCIAEKDNGERLTTASHYAMRYYTVVSKNKRDFCMEMRRYYKASCGRILKLFEEFEVQQLQQQIQQTRNMDANLKYQSDQYILQQQMMYQSTPYHIHQCQNGHQQ